jgi:translation initiation factor 5A
MEQYIESYKKVSTAKRGDIVLIEDRPAKVLDTSTSKTGKHGSAKAKITAMDIFNDKKYIFLGTTTDNIAVPVVVKSEYLLIDLANETLTVLDDKNESQDFAFLCPDENLKNKISQDFASGKEVTVTILAAIGTHQVIDSKISKE